MGIFQFHRTIKVRLIQSFLSTAVGSMIFPFMAIYFSAHFAMKTVGLLLLINVFFGIAISLFGGYFSDNFGRKKLIVFAEFLRVLAFATMMLCNSPWFVSPLITFFMTIIHTICTALSASSIQAMLIDVSKPEERKLMFSMMFWASNMSIAIGGILGGLFFKEYFFELLIALLITSVIAFLLMAFFIDETVEIVRAQTKSPVRHALDMFANYREVFQDQIFVWYVAAGVLVLSMEFQLSNYVGIRLAREFPKQPFLGRHIGGIEMAGFLRTENTILVVILALLATKLISRFKDRHVMTTSWLIFVAGYAVVSYSNHLLLLCIAMFLASVAEVMRVPVEQSYLANIIPADARGSYLSVSGMRHNLAQLICSITVTASAYLTSLGTTVFITCLGLMGILIFLRIAPALDARANEGRPGEGGRKAC